MNIVIIGQGAIGLLWYYNLSKNSQNSVTLLCSNSKKQKPRKMQFIDIEHQQHFQKVNYPAMNNLADADLIIFCLKAYQLHSAFKQYLTPNIQKIPIILCHNGMINNDILPKNQIIISMLLTHGAQRKEDFVVQHTGAGVSDLGLIQGHVNQNNRQKIIDILNQALPKAVWHENIQEKQWIKLAINCVINPLTALHNCNNGELLQQKYQKSIQSIIGEVVEIASFDKVSLSRDNLEQLVLEVAKKTANNCSSMRADILANRKTEIAHINGFIHQKGVISSIKTPMNSDLYKLISDM